MSGRGERSVKGMFSDSADSVKSPGRTVVAAAAQEGENKQSFCSEISLGTAPCVDCLSESSEQHCVTVGVTILQMRNQGSKRSETLPRFHCE